ncbi:MAG: very short patch repair endonuclease [Hamadaea sp.]|nr:very short patch repair endonuclease [Hamadaea sp.]NUT19444.1 very short patch repair endonuclease [Hamadaea sp.]
MSRQRSRNTEIEVALRRELHRIGMRFRVHRRPLPELRREADIVFSKARVAVFVDGCFWHGCPRHATWPKNNDQFWQAKIERNQSRDVDTDRRLEAAGWVSIRVWEHEDPMVAAPGIAEIVQVCRRNWALGVHRPGVDLA